MSRDQDLDWSVTDDAGFDQPEPASTPPARRGPAWWRWLVRWQAAVIGLVVIAGVASGVWVERWWQARRLSGDIQAAVTAEDESILAGERPQTMSAVAIPLSVSSLAVFGEPRPEVGQVMAVERLTADTVRALVRRRISDANGVDSVWAESQWYQYTADGWRRTGLADAGYSLTELHTGRFADWKYAPADDDYVRKFAPVVDELVSDICAQTACPDGLRFGFRFSLFLSSSANDSWSARFGLAQYPDQVTLGPFSLYRLSPLIRGVPWDDAARAHKRRWLERVVLVAVQHRLWTVEQGSYDRAIAHLINQAMWIRIADRRGLDPIAASTWVLPDPRLPDLTTWSSAGGNDPFTPDEAQVLVNRLLADVDPDTERRLLHLLPTSSDPLSWLAGGMQVDPESARLLWHAAAAPQTLAWQPERVGDYVVRCDQAGSSASPGEIQAKLLTAPRLIVPGTDAVWSPNGDRLVTANGVLYDFGRGTISALRGVDQARWQLPVWLDNDRFFLVSQLALDGGARLYTLTGGQPPGVSDYPTLQTVLPSPDRRWLAVIMDRHLMIQSVRDPIGVGSLVGFTGEFYQPGLLAWSVDSRRLAFVSHHPGALDPTASVWATVPADGGFVSGTLAALDDWLLADRLRRFDQVSFGPEPDVLTLTAIDPGNTTSVFRYAMSEHQLVDVTAQWLPTDVFYALPGRGVVVWSPAARQAQFIGVGDRVVNAPPGLERGQVNMRTDPLTHSLISETATGRFIWSRPAAPGSSILPLELPCESGWPRPAP